MVWRSVNSGNLAQVALRLSEAYGCEIGVNNRIGAYFLIRNENIGFMKKSMKICTSDVARWLCSTEHNYATYRYGQCLEEVSMTPVGVMQPKLG